MPLRPVANVASTNGYASGSLVSNTMVKRGANVLVPLLHPATQNLPFAAAIELHSQTQAGESHITPSKRKRDFYEVRFVLDGYGTLVHEDGSEEELSAGDTVLMTSGMAECRISPINADVNNKNQHDGNTMSWGMASLVVYMPKRLVELAGSQQGPDNDEHALVQQDQQQQECRELMQEFTQEHWGESTTGETLPSGTIEHLLAGAKRLAQQSAVCDVTRGPVQQAVPAAEQELSIERPSTLPPAHSNDNNSIWSFISSTISQIVSRMVSSKSIPTMHRRLKELTAFQLPSQTNQVALVFDPLAMIPVPFLVGVEIFDPGHYTTPHKHDKAHEIFFLLSGDGEGFCDGRIISLGAGDIVAFRPGAKHGIIHNRGESKLYCLVLMLPNDQFAEFIRAGKNVGALDDEDTCKIARLGCS